MTSKPKKATTEVWRADPFPVACLVADLHLSLKPPAARSAEPDWLATQRSYLQQLEKIAAQHQCPVICAGDVFDSWQQPAELINMCLRWLPHLYAVCGQHDLRHHDLGQLHRTSFWTLVEAKKISYLAPGKCTDIGGGTPLRLHGFPWGCPVKPPKETFDLALSVAVCHDYFWTKSTGYEGAPAEKRVKNRWPQLTGYDVVITGDNHIPFDMEATAKNGDRIFLYNCGSFLRRKQDERDHKPSVGILSSDGTVERVYLDVSQDRFSEPAQVGKGAHADAVGQLLQELNHVESRLEDFATLLRHLLVSKKITAEVERLALKMLED